MMGITTNFFNPSWLGVVTKNSHLYVCKEFISYALQETENLLTQRVLAFSYFLSPRSLFTHASQT
ncbi:hypothetical protein, partial [Streptococcus anginosus]|uniref:hypothetical protein n=1 Tax=Streptococcus anginosus TaxID=1328 RepID=UPI002EDB6A61